MQRGIPAMARSGGNTAVTVTVIVFTIIMFEMCNCFIFSVSLCIVILQVSLEIVSLLC